MGGMGVGHAAYQPALGREVALKRVRSRDTLQELATASLLTEARIQGALDHPNIVPIHELGQDANGDPVLVRWRESSARLRGRERLDRVPRTPHGAPARRRA